MCDILWGNNKKLPDPKGKDTLEESFTIDADPTYEKKPCEPCRGLGIMDNGGQCLTCNGLGFVVVITEVSIGPRKK